MSTRYNTGNPIESTDVRDMSDNAKNFDEFSNSMSESFDDRFGRSRQTIDGLIRKAGFQPASFDFATGGTLVYGERNKAVFNPSPSGDDNWYVWQGELPKTISPSSTPATSGGLGDNAWKPVTNNILAPTVRESARRSCAEAGYNLVSGSFQAGFSLVNANDVVLDEATGKSYSGSAGTYPPGTSTAGFVENALDYSVRAGRGIIKRGHFQNYSYFKHFESQPSGNGSRLYSLPTADHVTDGVGGVFKIFGDDFSNDVDYRDMGWYFHANQSNYAMGPGFDTGTWGNGVFWLNSKVGPTPGSTYGNKNPDIGFSFDDGVVVPGRIVRFGDFNFHWVIGPLLPQIAKQTSEIGLESQKDFAFLKGKKIRWQTTVNTADSYIEFGADLDEFRVVIRGVTVMVWNRSVGIDYDKGVAAGSWPQPLGTSSHTAGSTSLSAANKSYSTITAGQTIATITNGRDGQFFTLHFSGASTVDSSAGNIRLKGNVSQSFAANDTLLLQRISNTWREVSITKV